MQIWWTQEEKRIDFQVVFEAIFHWENSGNSLAVEWLELCPFIAGLNPWLGKPGTTKKKKKSKANYFYNKRFVYYLELILASNN